MSRLTRLLRAGGILPAKPPQVGGHELPHAPPLGPAARPPAPSYPEFASFSAYNGPGAPGFITDFLGVKTRVAFLPAPYQTLDGMVCGYPPFPEILHETEEWLGGIRSVLEARWRFVVLELGAGWAPWLVALGTAARRRKIRKLDLVAVEASAPHCVFIEQHAADNGMTEAVVIHHAAVGVSDGTVRFKKVERASEDYGAESVRKDAEAAFETVEVKQMSLAGLLRGRAFVDLIHCDIQGLEADVFEATIGAIDSKVHRVVIGTHSNGIHERLARLFDRPNWLFEFERQSTFDEAGRLLRDGVQVWRNRKVPGRFRRALSSLLGRGARVF
jgi:FkbM family methyltransferase